MKKILLFIISEMAIILTVIAICSWPTFLAIVEFIVKCLVYVVFYMSLFCIFCLFLWVPIWYMEKEESLFPYSRIKTVTKSLLCLAISFIVFFLSARARSFLEQPTINKVIPSSGYYFYCDTLKRCNSSESSFYYTIRKNEKGYAPSRKDTCTHCGKCYWKHHRKDIDLSLRLQPDPLPL